MKKLVVAVVTCLIAVPSHAQDIFMSLTRSPMPISDTPVNVEVITSQDFEKTSARTVADAIEHVPGVIVQKTGSEGSLALATVRGFTAQQVLLVIDDVPQIPDLTGNVDLSHVRLDNVARIEIVRGGGSAVYGPNAQGGVIHVITKRPAAKVNVEATSEAGSYKTYRNRGLVGSSVGPVQAQFSASRDLSDGFQENSSFRNTALTGLAGVDAKRLGKLAYNMEWTDGKNGLPSGTPVPIDQWDGEKERQANDTVGYQLTKTLNNRLAYSNRVNGMDLNARVANNVANLDAFQFGSLTTIRTEGRNAFAQAENSNWGSVGYEYYQRRLDSNVYGKHQSDAWGTFVLAYLNIADRLHITPGVRYDIDNAYGEAWSPRIQLVGQLNEQWKVSASANRAFRPPTFADLYNPFVPAADQSPNLRPEFTWIYDVGLSGKPHEGWDTSLSAFYSQTKDKIALDANKNFAAYNLDKAYSWGIETQVGYDYKALRQKLGYSYLDARATSVGSDYLTQSFTPKHKVDYRADLSLPWRMITTLDLLYLYKQWTGLGETGVELPDYAVMNLKLTKQVGTWLELFVACNNVLDRHYAGTADAINGYFPQPNRNYLGGLTIRFLK